jgi:hypothetical protein
MQAAHTWRREEEMPKDLLPKINKIGTINPMIGPATYHGQGCLIISMIVMNEEF